MKSPQDMNAEERATRVQQLFRQIAFIGDSTPYKHTDEVYPLIKKQVLELHAITEYQRELGELPNQCVGQKPPILT